VCYAGRWPHVHFEIYESLETATASGNVVHTSQFATVTGDLSTGYTARLTVGAHA
jgi:hypothetical protein